MRHHPSRDFTADDDAIKAWRGLCADRPCALCFSCRDHAQRDAIRGSIVIDGGFAGNLPFARCLAALRPSQGVSVSQSRDGTALGAALLWQRFARTLPVSRVVLEAVTPLAEAGFDRPGLSAAYQSWIAFSEQAP